MPKTAPEGLIARLGLTLAVSVVLTLTACDSAPNSQHETPLDNNLVADGENSASENASASASVSTNQQSDYDSGYTAEKQVVPGIGAFLYPPEMAVGEWYTLEFAAGPDMASLGRETDQLPTSAPNSIFVGRNMKVSLVSDENFEIKPESEPIQDTGVDRTASWQWNVRPIARGSRYLIAKVEILRKRPDNQFDVVDRFTRRVAVQVKVGTWQGFLAAVRSATSLGDLLGTLFRSWEKTLTALAALIGAIILVRRALRRRNDKNGPPET